MINEILKRLLGTSSTELEHSGIEQISESDLRLVYGGTNEQGSAG